MILICGIPKNYNMASQLNAAIMDALSENGELTLKELYAIIEDNKELDLVDATRKHRVRSGLYSLQQSEKVERSSPRTYKLVESD